MRSRLRGLFRSTNQGLIGAQRVNHYGVARHPMLQTNVEIDQETKLMNFWVEKVRLNGALLEMVPESMRLSQICEAAVRSDPIAIKHVPPHILHETMIVEAVSRKFEAFFLVPKNMRTEKVYLALAHHQDFTMALTDHNLISKEACKFAIQFNSVQANHAPEKFKADTDAYLAGVKYLIVRQSLHNDEVKHSAISYARSDKRKAISLCAYPEFTEDTLKVLTDKGAADVNLVFLAHRIEHNRPFAKFHTSDVVAFLEQYPIINKVTLLGCMTVTSAQLAKEAEMIQRLAASSEENKCGLILLETIPDESQYAALLAKTKLNRTFVMTKDALLCLEVDEQGEISAKASVLDAEAFEKIKSKLGPDKTVKFRKDSEKMIVRNHMSPLSPPELKMFSKINDGTDRFTKAHSQYKADKSKYPFLASFSIDQAEKDKLKPSHVLSLINAIEASDKITRDIAIKGYPNRISVDQIHQANISTEDDIFTLGQFGFFTDRIDRPRLAKMREASVRKLQTTDPDTDTTQAKSIQYLVRKYH